MSQQYHGSAVDIVYSIESLCEIFANNIRREQASRLVLPDRVKDEPVAAFFGTTHVTHGYTGEREDLFDYVCRHTLLRPRDFMTIGQRVSAMRPSERAEEPASRSRSTPPRPTSRTSTCARSRPTSAISTSTRCSRASPATS